MLTIGTAPDAWGVWFAHDPRQPPWRQFLDEVAAVGYRWIELGPYGYLPTDPMQLRHELAARDLQVTGSFVHGPLHEVGVWPDLERQVLAMGELLARVEARYLVLMTSVYDDPNHGQPATGPTLNEAEWQRLIAVTHRVADLAHEQFGLQTVFHPHAGMYVETEAEIETLLAATDPGRVGLCLDTGMHAYVGADPVAFLARHSQRILYLHLKSVDGAVLNQVRANRIPINAAVALDVFCEPDRGLVDFPALFTQLQRQGYAGWGIVEHDLYPTAFDRPLPIARRSLAYYRSLLQSQEQHV